MLELILAADEFIAAPGYNLQGIGLELCAALTSGIGPQANIRYTLDGSEPVDEGNI